MSSGDLPERDEYIWLRRQLNEEQIGKFAWPPAKFPENSPGVVVVADGLASRSEGYRDNPHLIEVLRGPLQPFGEPCAFSYYDGGDETGLKYNGRDTNISLRVASRIFQAYRPRGIADSVTYIGFSLGALTFIVGLARLFDSPTGLALASKIPALVLIQPVFELTEIARIEVQQSLSLGLDDSKQSDEQDPVPEEDRERLEKFMVGRPPYPKRLPPLFYDAIYRKAAMQERLESSIRRIRKEEIPIVALVWKDDPFAPYPDEIWNRVERAGVKWMQIPDYVATERRGFLQHCGVPRNEATHRLLESVMQAVQDDPAPLMQAVV